MNLNIPTDIKENRVREANIFTAQMHLEKYISVLDRKMKELFFIEIVAL